MSGYHLDILEAQVRNFDPVTKIATVVMPGPYGMEPIECPPFTRTGVLTDVPLLQPGDRVLVTQSENEPPEWTVAHADTGPLAAWPVGSIFMSAVATSPATLLGGGTWTRFGQGRTLFSQWSSDTDFDTVEETGGSKTISAAMLPAHSHTMDHNHVAATTAGPSVTNTGAADVSHTHTFSDTTTGADVSHTHTWSDTAGTVSTHAGHTHNIDVRENPVSGSAGYIGLSNAGGTLQTRASDTAGSHTHTVSVSGTTSGHSVNHTHVASGTTGGHSVNHTHSLSAHTHTVDFAATSGLVTGNGPGTAANSLPPYIVVYMWKRTA